jgi:hypothetical protein
MTQKPPVWQMIRAAVEHVGGPASYEQIRDYIHGRWRDVNERTINAHLISCCVNQPSRVHYPRNSRPRIADRPFDLLYTVGRGWVELYDPSRHGVWEIRQLPSGSLAVARASAPTASCQVTTQHPRQPATRAKGGGHDPGLTPPPASFAKREIPLPTVNELNSAARTFQQNETRQCFYHTASRDIERALTAEDVPALRGALWVLLSTWNAQYYRFRPPTAEHYADIDALLKRTWARFCAARTRSLEEVAGASPLPDLGSHHCQTVWFLSARGREERAQLLALHADRPKASAAFRRGEGSRTQSPQGA